jgi:hypothetical protein
MQQERYAGGHEEVLRVLFKGATVIAEYSTGGYSGTVGMGYLLEDGRYVVLSDFFGSCSGCDSWEGSTNEDAHRLCIELANNAKYFNTIAEAIAFLAATDKDADYYSYHDVALPLIGKLAEWAIKNENTWGWN